ncbi:MAG: hypothetical protein RIR83_1118, partial [Pseudomonadota bacterium]
MFKKSMTITIAATLAFSVGIAYAANPS